MKEEAIKAFLKVVKEEKDLSVDHPLMKVVKAFNHRGTSMTKASLKRQRKALEHMSGFVTPTADIEIRSFTVGAIACEEIRPKVNLYPHHCILYAHGGGYICGGLGYARILAAKLALATGITTYSFDYRLAPEHPYPAAIKDGLSVWEYLTKDLYQPENVFAAGDSAGGNLILCMSRRLIKNKGIGPAGLLLFSPWTDMTGKSESYDIHKDDDPILTREYVMWAAKAYIAGAGNQDDPRFSPLFGKLDDLPTVYIMVGRNEILLNDSLTLQKKITESGGRAILDMEEKGWHVYQQMPVLIAEKAMERAAKFITGEINERLV